MEKIEEIAGVEKENQVIGLMMYTGYPLKLSEHLLMSSEGKCLKKKKIAEENSFAFYECAEAGLAPINAISRKAIINPDVVLGKGIVISPGVILSHGVKIGDNVILDPAVVMDVNSSLGAHCYISAGVVISGKCEVEKNVMMGAGVIVESCLKVGKNQTVAAGTVVSESLDGLYRKESE